MLLRHSRCAIETIRSPPGTEGDSALGGHAGVAPEHEDLPAGPDVPESDLGGLRWMNRGRRPAGVPSGLKATPSGACPRCLISPVASSQTNNAAGRFQSRMVAAILCPSGLKATLVTRPAGPLRLADSTPVEASQTRMRLGRSADPATAARRLPSGSKARAA